MAVSNTSGVRGIRIALAIWWAKLRPAKVIFPLHDGLHIRVLPINFTRLARFILSDVISFPRRQIPLILESRLNNPVSDPFSYYVLQIYNLIQHERASQFFSCHTE